MASNYNRKSNSSGRSQKSRARSTSSTRQRSNTSSGRPRSYKASTRQQPGSQRISSVRVGDINEGRVQRVQKSYRRYVIRIMLILAFIAALLAGGIFVYNSDLFTIENIEVKGVEHLTATEMTDLASVPAGTTLLRVDEAGIKSRLSEEAWVDEVKVNRIWPDTLELEITERQIMAIVEVPVNNAESIEEWAIASGGMWLAYVPPQNTEEGQLISTKIHEDAASVRHITEVPYGLIPEVGTVCSDETVNNALEIIGGLTTELAEQIKTVSATGTQTTTLVLDNGVEIAFGTADNIREKERVCLQLMEEHPDQIAYINVRVVERPTWRSVD